MILVLLLLCCTALAALSLLQSGQAQPVTLDACVTVAFLRIISYDVAS
jgi:hypothetical protein